MKRYLIGGILVLTSLVGSAQEGKGPGDESRKEKIEAAKIAFITKELELTTEEAQKFWPVYNQKEDELKSLHKEMRKKHKDREPGEMSDAELEKHMDEMFELKQKELDIEKKYHAEFKKVLPVKKVGKLYMAEREFKHEVLKELRERKGPKGDGPHHREPGPDPQP